MSHSTAKPKCPACQQEVITFSDGQCVVCPLCSKVKRCVFRFCRDCQRQWPRNTSPSSICKQENCAVRAALLSDERISDPNSSAMGCPYFRACPKCNALLTHTGEGCRNIVCPECHTEFCFRCLESDCFLRDDFLYATDNDGDDDIDVDSENDDDRENDDGDDDEIDVDGENDDDSENDDGDDDEIDVDSENDDDSENDEDDDYVDVFDSLYEVKDCTIVDNSQSLVAFN